MAVETVAVGTPFMFPVLIIVAIVAVVVAWKVLKFSIKKITAILQGLIALGLIGLALAGQPQGLPVWSGLVGLGLLFGAISNFFS